MVTVVVFVFPLLWTELVTEEWVIGDIVFRFAFGSFAVLLVPVADLRIGELREFREFRRA